MPTRSRTASSASRRATTRKTTIGFVNLGCSKNQVDSEVMLGSLVANGFELTPKAEEAEVVIVNTCGFIDAAKQESINTILEHAELKQTGACKVLIAAGCLVQRYQDGLLKELPELDGIVGTGEFGKIAEITRALLAPTQPRARTQRSWISPPPFLYDALAPRLRLGRPHSAYLKIAEGCNRTCAFCAIPIMRGKQRSRPIESIVLEAQKLVDEGVQELNLISQDTINYGVDLGLRQGLVSLLRALVKVKGVRWIRPFYLYPQQVSDELLALYAGEETITKYIDMPLQHIDDAMLRRMHRIGDQAALTALVEQMRARIPGVTFRTAFIVGFPGETDAMYENLTRFVTEQEFDRVAVFGYSDEEGTPAVAFDDKVDASVIAERRTALLALQDDIAQAKGRDLIGSTREVLVDGPSEEHELVLEGRHEGQAPEIDGVVYLNETEAEPGDVITVQLTDAVGYDLVGAEVGGRPKTRARRRAKAPSGAVAQETPSGLVGIVSHKSGRTYR